MATFHSPRSPGVLSAEQIRILVDDGFIQNIPPGSSPYGCASLDLHISDTAWHLPAGSCKPSRDCSYEELLSRDDLIEPFNPDGDYFRLHRGEVYVFRLTENIRRLENDGVWGQATARSSIGRLDILARLVADRESGFEKFSPESIGTGWLYLEVVSHSADVRIRRRESLNQLRLFWQQPALSEGRGALYFRSVPGLISRDLTVDLSEDLIGGLPASAFELSPPTYQGADGNSELIVDSELKQAPGRRGLADPCSFLLLRRAKRGRLTLQPGVFYIIRSKEHIRVPDGFALYCQPFHEALGEMRIHYAGFVHPWFGHRDDSEEGTPLIFEIRGHGGSCVSIADGEPIGHLQFFDMSQPALKPDTSSAYTGQRLQASTFFRPWPDRLSWIDPQTAEGRVKPAAEG